MALHPAVLIMIAAVGVAAVVLAGVYGSHSYALPAPIVENGNTTTTGSVSAWWQIPALAAGVLLVVGAGAALIARDQRFRGPQDRAARISRLTAALSEAMATIAQVQREVDEGQRVLAELERDTEVKRQLAQLTTEEAAAVLSKLQDTVRIETTRGTRWSLVIAAAFFGLGIAVSYLIH